MVLGNRAQVNSLGPLRSARLAFAYFAVREDGGERLRQSRATGFKQRVEEGGGQFHGQYVTACVPSLRSASSLVESTRRSELVASGAAEGCSAPRMCAGVSGPLVLYRSPCSDIL
jgi:hypothetical protein